MARALRKRAIERYVVIPLSNLIATNQIEDRDIIFVSFGVAFLIAGWLRMPQPTAPTELKA
jgi:hypothetical protein